MTARPAPRLLRRRCLAAGLVLLVLALAVLVLVVIVAAAGPGAEAAAAVAQAAPPPPKQDLTKVIDSITKWVVGILASLATLFLTIGGLRYLLAGGDPAEVTKAKDTLKYAAIGYGVAILAPVLVKILQGFVSG